MFSERSEKGKPHLGKIKVDTVTFVCPNLDVVLVPFLRAAITALGI